MPATQRRYAAFLRGVMPMNCKMPELKKAFEKAGFKDVKTVLGSGNVVFSAASSPEAELEKKAEAAMQKHLGRTFFTIVRSVDELQRLLKTDPYAKFKLEPDTKRMVTFFRGKTPKLDLPVAYQNARILAAAKGEVFTAVVREPGNASFMVLIERALGKEVTTRTWETVQKVAK